VTDAPIDTVEHIQPLQMGPQVGHFSGIIFTAYMEEKGLCLCPRFVTLLISSVTNRYQALYNVREALWPPCMRCVGQWLPLEEY
jgi:hypothetical protein